MGNARKIGALLGVVAVGYAINHQRLSTNAARQGRPEGVVEAGIQHPRIQVPMPPLPGTNLPDSRPMPSMASFLAASGPTVLTLEWSNAPVEDGSRWETGLADLKGNDIVVLPYGTGGVVRATVTNTSDSLYVRAFNRIKGTH